MPVIDKRGVGLLEIVVALGVFMLFAIGIYGGIQYTSRTVFNSRLKIIETAILNEQIEILRNMPFEDVGILNGSPAGRLARTVTTTRNNIEFTITRTIRNVDDPFDGTIELGNDLSPADYKTAHIEIICSNCGQQMPIEIDTIIPPKYLEGNPDNGALFIEVLDANGLPVQGATVNVIATSTDPAINLTDTTNNSGKVLLVDVPAGQNVYDVQVSKVGYTTDGTTIPSVGNPNPTQPMGSVVAQTVSSMTLSIDQLSDISLQTSNSVCAPIANADVRMRGSEIIGTEPDVLLTDTTIQTDGNGQATLNNLHWDDYTFTAIGYDIIGSIPITTVSLTPNLSQPVELILGANTNHSLLVHVQDSINQQPVSNATVVVTSTAGSYEETTGVGHVQQTAWEGGDGQALFVNEDEYFADDAQVDVSAPGVMTLAPLGLQYVQEGELESSTFDLGVSANLVNISWEPVAQPAETGADPVQFQIASSNTSTPAAWDYRGPDGTSSTFYTDAIRAITDAHDGDQYIRYKAYLSTASTTFTPSISDIAISYTTSCTPPGQSYFGNLSSEEHSITVTADGYQPYQTAVTVSGDTDIIAPLVAAP